MEALDWVSVPVWGLTGVARRAVVSVREVARAESRSCLAPLELVERLGIRTWLGRAAGTPVVARWLGEPAEYRSLALPEVLGRVAGLPFVVPLLGTVERDEAIWLVSELDRGISLRRLLAVAKLSPLQAGALAADLVGAVEAMHAAGHVHGRLQTGNVQIGLGGELRLTDWAVEVLTALGSKDDLARSDRRAAAAVTAQLIGGADRVRRSHGGRRADLLDGLEPPAGNEEPAAEDPGRLGADLAAILGGPEERAAARIGIAELVAAEVRTRQLSLPRPEGLPTVARLPAAGQPGTGWQRHRLLRRLRAAGAPIGRVAVTLALLSMVVGGEFVLVGDRVARNMKTLGGGPGGTAAAATRAPAPRQPPVPALPLSVGPIAAVDLRGLDPCRPGDRCTLVVDVRVHRHRVALRALWRL